MSTRTLDYLSGFNRSVHGGSIMNHVNLINNKIADSKINEYPLLKNFIKNFDDLVTNQTIESYSHDQLQLEKSILTRKQAQLRSLKTLISFAIKDQLENLCIQLYDPDGYLIDVFTWYDFGPGYHFCVVNNNQKELQIGKIIRTDIFFDFSQKRHWGNGLLCPIFDLSNQMTAIILVGSRETLSIESILKIYSIVKIIQNAYHNDLKIHNYSSAIIDEIPDCVLLFDNLHKLINANKRCLDIINVPEYELFGVNFGISADEMPNRKIEYASSERLNINIDNRVFHCLAIKHKVLPLPNGTTQHMLIFKVEHMLSSKKSLNTSITTPFFKIVGESNEITKIKLQAQKIAAAPSNVLIQGESGTGKELLAESIHLHSGRKGPFIPINCGAIPKELLQSELFGYSEGTFTGGKKEGKIGKLEAADQGTLFLDEIGEMPADMQVNLLRFLQDRTVVRLGSNNGKKVDVRIISATNRDLKQEVLNQNFREDLYYRLNVFRFAMPPLRHRTGDIPLLIKQIVTALCQEYHLNIPVISPEVMDRLVNYDWPGNVRELRNIVEVLLFSSVDDLITMDLLPEDLLYWNVPMGGQSTVSHPKNPKKLEKGAIMDALIQNKWNLSRTADSLAICRKTLYNKIKAFDIKIN